MNKVRNHKHGLSKHPLYFVWKAMRARCQDSKRKDYHYYGGRGIRVCKRWSNFYPFFIWAMSNNWERGLQIDRVNNDGEYSPENCRLTTAKENAKNKRPQKVKKMLSTNKSGFIGVSLENGKFRARFYSKGKRVCLGFYESPELASFAIDEYNLTAKD